MRRPLQAYIVKFQDTLRVSVAVHAASPMEAEQKAIQQWSDDLWQKADPALANTDSEIIESFNRDFFEVEEDITAQHKSNESIPS